MKVYFKIRHSYDDFYLDFIAFDRLRQEYMRKLYRIKKASANFDQLSERVQNGR
jgi:hypothetical protein